MSTNPVNLVVDRSGIINTTVMAHVQAQTVNKVSQTTSFAEEMAKASQVEEALDKITLQSGQVGELTSSEITNEIRDEEEGKDNQFQEFTSSEKNEENEEYKDDAMLHPDPLVGNLLNIKI